MKENKGNRIKLFVLNNFIRFEKKIYQVLGFKLGRPISFKLLIYAFVFGLIEIAIYITPGINILVRWMPFVFLVGIPIALAWLLNDVGTENRKPVSFFKSFFNYHLRKFKGDTYFRDREVQKTQNYTFAPYFTYQESTTAIDIENEAMEKENKAIAKEEMEKAMRYLHRIYDVDDFIEMKKEQKRLEAANAEKVSFWKKIIPFKNKKTETNGANESQLKEGA